MGDRDRLRHRVVAALVKGYRVLGATGMLRHPLIRRLHTHTYFAGKRSLEDHLAPFLTRFPSVIAGGHALDIGANIGYTSVVLARALSPGFRVFAFEPEQHNVETLRDNVRHFSVEKHVQVEAAAVGDHDGTAELWVNPGHPADHRILTSAFAATNPERASHQVAVVSIDSFVERLGLSPIRFVKIDVQGYELAVLQGMQRLLAGTADLTLAIEYGPRGLQELGFDPQNVLALLRSFGFQMFVLGRGGRVKAFVEQDHNQRFLEGGYVDLICRRPTMDSKHHAA